MFQDSFFYQFLSILRIFFSHSFRISLLVTHSLHFPSSENILIPPSFLKDIFTGCSRLTVLFFQHLKKCCAICFSSVWFLMKNLLHLNWFSSTGKVSFLSLFPRVLSSVFRHADGPGNGGLVDLIAKVLFHLLHHLQGQVIPAGEHGEHHTLNIQVRVVFFAHGL